MYVGTSAIAAAQLKQAATPVALTSAHTDILARVVAEVDSEGRYLVFNAMANQLRYPNSHTHYFSCMLLHMFIESDKEVVKEQITRRAAAASSDPP
jgi:CCR4-NOT transcription complex subunit 1